MYSFKYYITEGIIDNLKEKINSQKYDPDKETTKMGLLWHGDQDSKMQEHVFNHFKGYFDPNKTFMSKLQKHVEQIPYQPVIALPENVKPPIHHIIDKLAEGDPSKDKKHLPQIVNWYSKGGFRSEDLGSAESHAEHKNWSTVHGVLSAFSDIKNKDLLPDIPHPDPKKRAAGQMLKGTRLSSYEHMDFPQFRDHVLTHLGLKQASDVSKLHEHPDIHLIGERQGTKLYSLESKDAAIHAAKCAGADWCTGWEGKDNMFDHYNDQGQIYLAHHADETTHQIHLQSHQFMDKKDSAVKPSELAEQYPGLKEFPHLQKYETKDSHLPFTNEDTRKKIVDSAISKLKSNSQKEKIRNSKLIAANGNNEQLKQAHDDLITSSKLLAHARRATEFNDEIFPHEGEKGTPEHLATLFTRRNYYRNLSASIGSVPTKYKDALINKSTESDEEFEKHFRHKVRQHSLYTAFEEGRKLHYSHGNYHEPTDHDRAHAFFKHINKFRENGGTEL